MSEPFPDHIPSQNPLPTSTPTPVPTPSGNVVLSSNVIDKILAEIKPLHIQRVTDSVANDRIFTISQSLSSDFTTGFINSFNTYVSQTETFGSVVQVTVTSITSLIKGTAPLTVNDIANFTTLLHSIYSEIDRINVNVNMSINSADLINMGSILIQVVLALLMTNDNEYQSVALVLTSAVKMLCFTMSATSKVSCSPFACFKSCSKKSK